jgi:hypothetical protein
MGNPLVDPACVLEGTHNLRPRYLPLRHRQKAVGSSGPRVLQRGARGPQPGDRSSAFRGDDRRRCCKRPAVPSSKPPTAGPPPIRFRASSAMASGG